MKIYVLIDALSAVITSHLFHCTPANQWPSVVMEKDHILCQMTLEIGHMET